VNREMKKTLILLLCIFVVSIVVGFLLCIFNNKREYKSHVLYTEDGLPKEYAEAFKQFRDNKAKRIESLPVITRFLRNFCFPKIHETQYPNPLMIPKEGIELLLGKPDRIESNGTWVYFAQLPNNKFMSDGIFLDFSNGLLVSMGGHGLIK